MKSKKSFLLMLMSLITCSCFAFSACDSSLVSNWVNPGDYLGGGQSSSVIPSQTDSENVDSIDSVTDNITTTDSSYELPDSESQIDVLSLYNSTEESYYIDSAGSNYVISGEVSLDYKITVKKNLGDVVIYLNNATISSSTIKNLIKVNEGSKTENNVTIVLVGTNTVTNSYSETVNSETEYGKFINSESNLTITGSGTLTITSTDTSIKCDKVLTISNSGKIYCNSTYGHGVNADTVIVLNSTLYTKTVDKDGIHAESDYDSVDSAPEFSYEVGYVYISESVINISVSGEGDGIQADSFIKIDGDSTNITIKSTSSNAGKGIKAGCIDYILTGSTTEKDIDSSDYTIYINGGTININTKDDAIHSNGNLFITAGNITINAGDDAIHSDMILEIYDSTDDNSGTVIDIQSCYEGLESAKITINGGTISIVSSDDGINAANTNLGNNESNFYLIINGGIIDVNAEGDGVDSNGPIYMTGGELYVYGPTGNDNGSLDSGDNSGVTIDGGYLFAVGSLGMVEVPASSSKQNVISYGHSSTISAGTVITLVDSSNNVLFSFTTVKKCQSIIISSPELVDGATYSIYGNGTLLKTFTISTSSTITSVGSTTSIGGGTAPGMSTGPNSKFR